MNDSTTDQEAIDRLNELHVMTDREILSQAIRLLMLVPKGYVIAYLLLQLIGHDQ